MSAQRNFTVPAPSGLLEHRCVGPSARRPVTDDVRDIVPGVIAAGISASPGRRA
ncbi:hypothetical protein ACWDZ4_08155 [Streptomyces sp. NPDC003016]